MAEFKAMNIVKVIGKVVDFDLEHKEYTKKDGSGEKYWAMTGSVSVEVAPDNITSLRYFQKELYNSGKQNRTYNMLKGWMDAPKDEQTGKPTRGIGELIEVNTSFGANAFVGNDGSLIENADIQGSFTDVLTSPLKPKSDFNVQAFIKDLPIAVEPKEDDEDGEVHWTLKAYLFDFRKTMFPVNFIIKKEVAADFFTDEIEAAEGRGIFIKIWGDVINSEIKTVTTQENAFGEELVVEHTKTRKANVITGASPEFPDLAEEENGYIIDAINEGRALYETYLAGVEENANGQRKNAIGESSESKKKDSGDTADKSKEKVEYNF